MRKALAMAAAASLAMLVAAGPAQAGCKVLGFSVNDYGKEGPIRDAKALLDKYIARWTAKRGIKNYTVGKKKVTCELYLDLIVFDEHTCKATAKFCWKSKSKPKPKPTAAAAGKKEG
ncbi:MAG: hypothetical protein AAFR04_08450 [Pseudomonadota bacterium]